MPEQPTTHYRHGLFGWYSANVANGEAHTLSFADCAILTNATEMRLFRDQAGVTCSNSVFPLGENGMAAIAGTPAWRSRELAAQSEADGPAAALATAWSRYGRDLFAHLGGAFALVVADPATGSLVAGIDRLGIETLYYSREAGRLLFGSTATSVLAQSGAAGALTGQGIYDYFYFHMVPSPRSVYRGLSKLPAAHGIALCDGGVEVFRYWTPTFNKRSSSNFSAAGEHLRRTLRGSVERAVEGAGTVGTFLSGGLDSSTVTGMLAEISGGTRPAYAIGFDQEGYDEMAFARNTARHFGVPLQEYYVTPQDVLDALPIIATSYDEPFGNSSALPAYFVGKRAREDGIDCLLAGDGGDEIFAGNERYAKQQVFSRFERLPSALREIVLKPTVALLPASTTLGAKARSYIRQAEVPLPDRLQTYNYLNRMGPAEIFSREFLETVDTEEPLELQRDTFHALNDASELSRMLYLDWQYTLADNDLRKVSRMCAVAGVGVRYPMLDEELVDFSCELPDHWKLQKGNLRHFFKASLTGWLPDETINKKKQGFGLPFGHWMQSYRPLNELANESLLRLRQRGYFRNDFLDRLVRLHSEEHAAYYGEFIWILTVFDLWLEGRKLSATPGAP